VASSRGKQLLGPWMATALVVGNIVGAGIFLLPATLAPFGQNAIYGWLLTIGGALCLAWVFAQLASRIEGGPYSYVRDVAGELPAFMVMWGFWISIWTGLPVLAIAAVSYASSIAPAMGGPVAAPLSAVAAVWLFVLVNMRGARSAGAVQVMTSVLKLMPLIAVVLVAAVLFGSGQESASLAPVEVSPGAIATAGTLALFSMLGIESASVASARVANPSRIVPRATMAGTALVGLIYLAATTAVLFLLPAEIAARSPAPFADAIVPALGEAAGTLVAAFAIISALGCLNGWILCAGEVPLGLARSGIFPRWLAVTTPIGTPVRAQLVSAALATLLIASNYSRSMADLFAFMLLVTTTIAVVLYLACSASALVLLWRGRVRAPLLGAAALIGLAFSVWAVWGAGVEAALWGLALLATGLPVYFLMRRKGGSTLKAEEIPAAPPAPAA
jgi:basic amino acid/polyamine antiporter, APA family